MTLFLMTMDCGYFALPSEHIGVNQEFGVSECCSGRYSYNQRRY
jgi:hypothetical protein